MLDWTNILDWIVILISIILTQSLILNAKYYTRSRGYMWRAVSWIWFFLLIALMIEFIIAIALFYLGVRWIPIPRVLWAALVGILAVLLPNGLEQIALYKNASERKVKNPLVRILRKLNLLIIHKFAWAKRSRMEQDVFDCNSKDYWVENHTRKQIARKIHLLYAYYMHDIARERRNPKYCGSIVNATSWQKLYILMEHLGRKRLRQQLANPLLPLESPEMREGLEKGINPDSDQAESK